MDLVHDAVKSKTDSVLAPITVLREINVLDPMVNKCNPSLQTVFPKTSNDPVQDLKSISDLVNCEFMVKSVSCASKYAGSHESHESH